MCLNCGNCAANGEGHAPAVTNEVFEIIADMKIARDRNPINGLFRVVVLPNDFIDS